jgi:hypothetical protein
VKPHRYPLEVNEADSFRDSLFIEIRIKGIDFDIRLLKTSPMELQKRMQIKREKYERSLRSPIDAKALKLRYSYNKESVFLWGAESVINQLKQLAGA